MPACRERVGDAGDERRLRADHHEVGALAAGELDRRRRGSSPAVSAPRRTGAEPGRVARRRACVAGRDDDLRDGWRAGEGAGERVLARAGAEHQHAAPTLSRSRSHASPLTRSDRARDRKIVVLIVRPARAARVAMTPRPSEAPHEHRASWDEYFMRIAREVASRATCDRKHVGAVIVRDKCILAPATTGRSAASPTATRTGT